MYEKNSIEAFLAATAQDESKHEFFQLENPHLLEINLTGQRVQVKKGAMVAYDGHIRFEREGILSQGLGNLFKKAISGEGTSMMHAMGQGRLYVADRAKYVHVINLTNDIINVNGNDVLAYEESVRADIKMLKSIGGVLGGGLFQVRLSGNGHIALTSHGRPITLRVTPYHPVCTDPNATIAWSGNLIPELKTDISLKTFIGRGSGESLQMRFVGDGWVMVQPYEEVHYREATKISSHMA